MKCSKIVAIYTISFILQKKCLRMAKTSLAITAQLIICSCNGEEERDGFPRVKTET